MICERCNRNMATQKHTFWCIKTYEFHQLTSTLSTVPKHHIEVSICADCVKKERRTFFVILLGTIILSVLFFTDYHGTLAIIPLLMIASIIDIGFTFLSIRFIGIDLAGGFERLVARQVILRKRMKYSGFWPEEPVSFVRIISLDAFSPRAILGYLSPLLRVFGILIPPVSAQFAPKPKPTLPLNVAYATFWQRALASLIDVFLFVVFSIITLQILITIDPVLGSPQSVRSLSQNPDLVYSYSPAPFYILFFVLPFLILSVPLYLWNGQTFGKKALKIKVVDVNGKEHLAWLQCLWRPVAQALTTSPTLFIGFFWYFVSESHQCWHDSMAHTYAIRINAQNPK